MEARGEPYATAERVEADTARHLALEQPEPTELTEEDRLRVELDALIEKQPDDVASLLRGWLTERA